MKTILALLIIFSAGLIVTSCQREVDEVTSPLVNPGDSLVSKIIKLDTSFASGSDTAQVLLLTYDASGRLTKIINTYYNPGISGPGRLDGIEDNTYLFSGSQTLPYRMEVRYTDIASGTISYDTSFYNYTDGYLSRDSVRDNFGATYVMTFIRLTSSRFKVFIKTDYGGMPFVDTMYSNLTWSGGNLLKEVDSLQLSGGAWQVGTINASYDVKPNPFKEFCIPHPTPFSNSMVGPVLTELALPTTNNLVSVSGNGPMNYTLTYEYGPTGLPKIIRDNSGSKYFYFYTAH